MNWKLQTCFPKVAKSLYFSTISHYRSHLRHFLTFPCKQFSQAPRRARWPPSRLRCAAACSPSAAPQSSPQQTPSCPAVGQQGSVTSVGCNFEAETFSTSSEFRKVTAGSHRTNKSQQPRPSEGDFSDGRSGLVDWNHLCIESKL